MIAPTKSLVGPTNLFLKPISNCQFPGVVVSFDQVFGRIQGLKQNKLLLLCHQGEKMEVIRKLSRGCFTDNRKKEKKLEVESVHGGEDIFDAEKRMSQEHLVIMVNGIVGSAADWRYAAEQFVKKLPDKVIVHRSECNYSKLTFDGVDRMGERLAGEVLDVIKRWPEVRKISFVAHSLGGLVARYAIGRLYELFPKMETAGLSGKCSSREHLNELTQHPDQHFEARVAGLEPMNFVTFATPHLGSRGHRQLPFLCGLPFLERSAPQTAHLIVGRSGKHLFLTDNDEGKRPLLVQMVNDSNDVKFMSALRSFKRRVAYANANYDYVVGWRTSSIRRQHELPKSNLLVKDEKYPHVVYVDRESMEKIHNGTSSMVEKQASDWKRKWLEVSLKYLGSGLMLASMRVNKDILHTTPFRLRAIG
ncbi:Lipase [Actinidia chinensis var. chinensis]|uniref:Lipase n=1 Tax=Actinidia chinensis var. chinensis TaxID=1590841 RepID=A0A2R6R4Y2_ACTCC|nr:Lipase [Actinidia chinensis var. chinensis]